MASVRNHIRIARSADDVWKVVSDAGLAAAWAPNVEVSSVSGNRRHVEFAEGFSLEEEIVTSDDELRRFQYRGIEREPMDWIATVDVIEDGAGSLVIYSTEIAWRDDPDGEQERASADWIKVNSAGFLRGLKEYLER
jgi:hypothetical protein